jgi:glycosyltransferase involved in cell wall biosynthesis
MYLSIVVPTYNSAQNLKTFFEALLVSKYTDFEVIVNDDKRTNDNTDNVVKEYIKKGLTITYKQENIMMAQARKKGTSYAKGEVVIHLDSDMAVMPELLGEIAEKMKSKTIDAYVIPEEAYGTTFWAHCKWLEKKMYIGESSIESLRVISKENYDKLGGHDEEMVFSEDKDFDIRVREAGLTIGHTTNYLRHNEGELGLFKTSKKKMGYGDTANVFARKHPKHSRWVLVVLNKYWIYAKNIGYIFSHPILYAGVLIMKTVEFASGGVGLLRKVMKL